MIPVEEKERLAELANRWLRETVPALHDEVFAMLDNGGVTTQTIADCVWGELLTSANRSAKHQIVGFLGESGLPLPKTNGAQLRHAFLDPDDGLRYAILYLAHNTSLMNDRRLLPFLRLAMRDRDVGIRYRACQMLRKVGRDIAGSAVQDLVRLLNDSVGDVRRQAVLALAWLESDAASAIPTLVLVALRDQEDLTRKAALQALLQIDSDATQTALAADLGEHSDRQALLNALRDLGESARSFRHALEAAWAAAPAQPNGPGPGYLVWWQGGHKKFSPYPFRVLEQLWGKSHVPVDVVMNAVWAVHEDKDKNKGKGQALTSALYKVNRGLADLKVPFSYSIEGDHIVKR